MRLKAGILLFLLAPLLTQGQTWSSIAGGNTRANTSPYPGLLDVSAPLWQTSNAWATDIGGNIYTFGDRFVTTRFQFSSPGQARVECRSLSTGALIWTSPSFGPASKVHAMGFNEDAVYVHDYADNNQRFYALNPETGQVKWSYPSYSFGPLDGPVFDCNRNPVFNTSQAEFNQNTAQLRSVDKTTGATRWILQEVVDTRPNRVKAASGSRLYMITGTALTPKRLTAINLETGQVLYKASGMAGASLQNLWPVAGPDSTVYVFRDGGNLFAYKDNGTGFSLKWQYTPEGFDVLSIPAVESDGNVLLVDGGRIKRVSGANGEALASSAENALAPSSALLSCSDSVVILCDRAGVYQGFSYDLQSVLWTFDAGGSNYYALPNLSAGGTMVMAGSGTSIYAFRGGQTHRPVASFSASRYTIPAGDSIQFASQSSFSPTLLEWEFEGGTPAVYTGQAPRITYSQTGTFRVRLRASNALGSDTLTRDCYITVSDNTQVADEKQGKPVWTFYPNPARDCLWVEGKNATEGGKLQLFNAQGKRIYEEDVRTFPVQIPLGNIPGGVYQTVYRGYALPGGKIAVLK